VNPLDGPLGEEPAWRGYALPRLQARRSPLASTAALCVLVIGWHLPLYFIPAFGLRPLEAITTAACTVVYAWIFNRSGGSALLCLVAHATEGTLRISAMWPVQADETRKAMYTAAWALVADALLVTDRRAWTAAPPEATWPATPEDGKPAAARRHAVGPGQEVGA
jgi:membrane protease YdiL (CAAX protease family)